jgi:hypothetical protein
MTRTTTRTCRLLAPGGEGNSHASRHPHRRSHRVHLVGPSCAANLRRSRRARGGDRRRDATSRGAQRASGCRRRVRQAALLQSAEPVARGRRATRGHRRRQARLVTNSKREPRMSKSHVFFFDVRNTLGVGPPARGSIRSAELKNLGSDLRRLQDVSGGRPSICNYLGMSCSFRENATNACTSTQYSYGRRDSRGKGRRERLGRTLPRPLSFGFGRLILSRPKPAVLVLRQLARLLPWRYGNGRSARNRNGSPPHALTARKGNRTPPARFAEVPYPIVVLTDPGFLRPSRR